jgi:hypothetical protein
MNRLDHLVIAAESLEQGVDYVRSTLGVDIPRGGVHQTMGTHNHLMQLGKETYLEVIAINPDGLIPNHPRWFNLDECLMRESLQRQPRLITWVMNTPDILRVSQQAKFSIGTPSELSRDNLRWQIALTEDGRLLAHGLLPYVIQWQTQPHPSNAMADLGCQLVELEIYHNRPDWLGSMLDSIGAGQLVRIHSLDDAQSPYLSATIETPSGIKILRNL